MSNALVALDYTQLPSVELATDEQFADASQGTTFLKRLQLYSKGKQIDTGKIRPGHYGVPEADESITDLGDEIDVIPFARRLKAIDMGDLKAIIQDFDPTSDTFRDIQARSQESESKCMWGPSFLVFERSTGLFLEFFCGSKSSRPEAAEMYPFLALTQAKIDALAAKGQNVADLEPHGPLPMTMKVRLAQNKKGHTWHVPQVQKCSTPFDNVPAIERVTKEILAFTTTKGDGVKKVTEEQGKKTRAR